MEELQTLNEEKETATNPMVTFMALNTSGVQLIPATMIAVLATAGSKNPTWIISTSLVATAIGTLAAVIAAKLLQGWGGGRGVRGEGAVPRPVPHTPHPP